MFDKILIANRGEIACRIIRTCKEMGIRTAAVYSEADRGARHVELADEAWEIGPAPVGKSYLNADAIFEAVRLSNAQAIHPGYGFFSENADFADRCTRENVVFIGPSAEKIRLMGEKIAAKKVMKEAGVPVLPGSLHPLQDESEAIHFAEAIGYPVMLKASKGGGGIGMQMARNQVELRKAWASTGTLAQRFFGSGELLIEKYVEKPRHVEVQVLADRYGHVQTLFERDCSIQRRNQKIIEEAPAHGLTDTQRERLYQAALDGVRAIGYENAGTMEFIMDAAGEFYFLEMNTRIQVEHPVTECVTGLDLIGQQIRIAAGMKLTELPAPPKQPDGVAIECRICAEDPDSFMPSPGKINGLSWPQGEGIRIDTGVVEGQTVSPFYDSMIAKVIAHGKQREQAIHRMLEALAQIRIEGIKTNIPLLIRILNTESFQEGKVHTGFLSENLIIHSVE